MFVGGMLEGCRSAGNCVQYCGSWAAFSLGIRIGLQGGFLEQLPEISQVLV